MKRLKETIRQFINDESAQGATEYILLLVVVVAIAMIFKDKIKTIVEQKASTVGDQINSF